MPSKLIDAILIAIILQIEISTIRIAFLFAFRVIYLIYLCMTTKIKLLRTIKLILFSIILIVMSIFGMVSSVKIDQQNSNSELDIFYFEVIIIALAYLGCLINIIFIIVEVCKSEDYKDYII